MRIVDFIPGFFLVFFTEKALLENHSLTKISKKIELLEKYLPENLLLKKV